MNEDKQVSSSGYCCITALFIAHSRRCCRGTQAREEHVISRKGIARHSQTVTLLMSSDEFQKLRFRVMLAWHAAFRSELASAHLESLAEADAGFGALQCTLLLEFMISLPQALIFASSACLEENIKIFPITNWNQGLVFSFSKILIHSTVVFWGKK